MALVAVDVNVVQLGFWDSGVGVAQGLVRRYESPMPWSWADNFVQCAIMANHALEERISCAFIKQHFRVVS
jgi:hypothetical protein